MTTNGLVRCQVTACAFALVSSCIMPLSAQEESPEPDFLRDGYYLGLSVGWAIPTGTISGITDLISFSSSVDASSVYDSGLAIGIFLGARFSEWMTEIDIDMRLSPVTDEGQALVTFLGPVEDRDVGVEYMTFEVFGGRSFTVGDSATPWVSFFGGAGVGVGLVQLSQGTGVEPHNDEGLSASVKLGMDLRLTESNPIIIRLSGRYQLLGTGVDIPNDVLLQAGVSYGFMGG